MASVPGIHHVTAIATDVPGFTVEEPAEQLGSALRLPRRPEPLRAELEHRLPAFQVPGP
jgi:glyoxalase family protein